MNVTPFLSTPLSSPSTVILEAAPDSVASSSQRNTPSPFERLRIILVEPSLPGNVGAVARAMKTMGFSRLVLVNPRYPDVTSHPEAIAFSSGAHDILERAECVSSMDLALEGCDIAAAVTARLREFSPPILLPREFAQRLKTHVMTAGAQKDHGGDVALVMGNERAGLPNALVEACNYLITIPANPDYSSLNLSQAVQVLAYECRVALITDANAGANAGSHAGTNAGFAVTEATTPTEPGMPGEIGFKGVAASVADINGMLQHLEQALIAIGFLDPASPKKLMSRLRRLFARTQLESEEVNIMRGIAKKMLDK